MSTPLQRLRELLWPAQPPTSRWHKRLLVVGRVVYALARDLLTGELTLWATSLVYTSVIAMVPLLAFSFSVLKGLGFHREMEPLLRNFLAPLGPQAEVVTSRVIGFVDNVSGSVLAGVSIVVLLFTVLSLAQKLENSFNYLWRVSRPRSLSRRFSEYLSVMLVGPVLMSASMGLIAAVGNTEFITRLRDIMPFGTLIASLSQLAPYAIVVGSFIFLYVFLPNTKVKIRAAVVGGLCGGILWVLTGRIYTAFVGGAANTQAIYAGFAVVIATMLWLYLSWLTLLVGARIAFYHQNPHWLAVAKQVDRVGGALSEQIALAVMLLVGRDFEQPREGWQPATLADAMQIPLHVLEPVLEALHGEGLLDVTAERRLVPGRSSRNIQLADIVHAVRGREEAEHNAEFYDAAPTVRALARRIEQALNDALANKSLADLIDEDGAEERPGEGAAIEARDAVL